MAVRPQLFVSYRRSQKEAVRQAVDALRAAGVDCFFDVDDIDPLADFPERIREGIDASHAMLVWWSADYAESDHCLAEFRRGWQHARRYSRLLARLDGVRVPQEPSWARSVYHLYVIRMAERDALRDFLDRHGIATGLHYPVPLHLQKAYAGLRYRAGDFPVAERMSAEILSLPLYPELTAEDQKETVGRIREFFRSR